MLRVLKITLAMLMINVGVLRLANAADVGERPLAGWTQWRGPNRDGSTAGVTWPEKLSDDRLAKLWTKPLQQSYSGPIVSRNAVFTTETVDRKLERVTALDRQTGQSLWTHQWEGAMRVPFFAASRGSWIRATPAFDGQTVYVGGIRDRMVALDAQTGEVRWDVDLVKRFGSALPSFGFASSPLIDGDSLYVQGGGGVVRLNRETGEVVWRGMEDGGGMSGGAFSSPLVATLNGTRQLLVQAREKLAGLDFETGRVLWSEEVPAYRGMNILTPTVVGNKVFTSTYRGKSFLYEIKTEGGKAAVDLVWENKLQAYMSSPVEIDGHVYVHLANRRFACIDLQTGKETWITKPYGQYWSMIAQGNKILALDETGELYLINANPAAFELVDQRTVSDESAWAHLAKDGDQLFVRGLTHLSAFQWK